MKQWLSTWWGRPAIPTQRFRHCSACAAVADSVLMGSMTTDLPVPYTTLMLNSWEIIGQFMYPAGAYRRLFDLLRSGLLDISPIRPRVFPLTALPEAMSRSYSEQS